MCREPLRSGCQPWLWAGLPCERAALPTPRPSLSPQELMRSRSIHRCRSMGQSPLLWRAVYENLIKYEGDTLDIVPNLAESYEVSKDGLTYTFKIRPGITFTDGAPLDAAAVKLSIERQIGVKQGIGYVFANVNALETPDDMTFVMTLSAPSDGILSAFAGMYAPYIISPKAITENEQDGDWAQGWLRDNMVGTGPYVLDSYSQSQQAVFSRNPDYWGGWDGEHFDQIIVSYVKEPATERLLLEQGEVDVALFLPDDAVEELDGTEGIVVTDVASWNLYYLVLPCSEKDQLRTRRSARRSPMALTMTPGSPTSCAARPSRHEGRSRATSSASIRTRRSTPMIRTRRERSWPRPATPTEASLSTTPMRRGTSGSGR